MKTGGWYEGMVWGMRCMRRDEAQRISAYFVSVWSAGHFAGENQKLKGRRLPNGHGAGRAA